MKTFQVEQLFIFLPPASCFHKPPKTSQSPAKSHSVPGAAQSRMKKPILVFFAFLLTAASLFGEDQQPARAASDFSLQFSPGVDIPMAESSSFFGTGGSVLLGVQYRLPSPPWFVSGALGYDYDPAPAGVPLYVSVGSVALGIGMRFDIAPWLALEAGVLGGYFFSFLSDSSASDGNPCILVHAGILLLPSPLHFSLGASFRSYLGLYTGIAASAGLSYDFPAGSAAPERIQENPPARPQTLNEETATPSASVELKELSFEDIFPVFHTYYDSHPLGKVVLHNTLDQPITDIKVSFQIKQFMDDPKVCTAPSELWREESVSVDLFGLFRPNILETTEATKAQAKVDIEYTFNGQVQRQSLVQTIRILDRNATNWTDDRKAAAFVTAKDPAVQTFSKNVNSVVKGKVQGAVNPNLLTAIALFETLHLFGLTYSQDPIPISTTNKQVADYIQFPRQTLEYKGGKCSDFSVLYSALLESVGIETAFITIPGHIFIAFSTALTQTEARKNFSRADDLIFRFEKSWIPVEVTESAGFLQAWKDGAKEWRENLARDQAAFHPIREAWKLYEPVGLPGAGAAVSLPPSEKILDRYQAETTRFVEQEIFPTVAALESQIKKAQDPRKPANELGVMYARYGLYDRAQREFEKLLAKESYVPALLNMGNVLYLRDQKEKALDYFNLAYAKDPGNPRVLLAVAKVCHDLENYFQVRKVYAELKARDPDLALQFAYLDLKGEEATRAAEAGGVAGVVLWEE